MNTNKLLFPVLLGLGLCPAANAAKPALPEGPPPVSEASVGSYWLPKGALAQPGVPAGVPDATEQVCVSLGYQIQADGSTSDFTLLRSWSSKHAKGLPDSDAYGLYLRMAVAATMQHKYAPAPAMTGKPVAIFTSSSYAFGGPATDAELVRSHCRIDDLPDFMKQAQADAYRRRGNLNKGRMDRARVMNPPIIGR